MEPDLLTTCATTPHFHAVLIYPSYQRAQNEFSDAVLTAAYAFRIHPGELWLEFQNGSQLRFFGCDETGDVYALAGMEFNAIEFPGWHPELAVENFARSRVRKIRLVPEKPAPEQLELDFL